MKHLKTPQQLNESSENLNISDVSRSFTIEDLKSAFEQGRSYQWDSGIASKSPKSMNSKDFKSWYKERYVAGSIDIMGIKTEPK
jgi:hypothetical protein